MAHQAEKIGGESDTLDFWWACFYRLDREHRLRLLPIFNDFMIERLSPQASQDWLMIRTVLKFMNEDDVHKRPIKPVHLTKREAKSGKRLLDIRLFRIAVILEGGFGPAPTTLKSLFDELAFREGDQHPQRNRRAYHRYTKFFKRAILRYYDRTSPISVDEWKIYLKGVLR